MTNKLAKVNKNILKTKPKPTVPNGSPESTAHISVHMTGYNYVTQYSTK